MTNQNPSLSRRLTCGLIALYVGLCAGALRLEAQSFPQYDHVFLIIMENNGYPQIIGSQYAPILNAIAQDYGIATSYTGVADPSEPNYVAMLGGDFFGISSDDPYFFPGQTVHADNLMSQLDAAGRSWKGYFQGMPYPGFRGYCYPEKCNGIPDADTQYVAKHNGIVNFANLQNPTDFGKMFPLSELSHDLSMGTVPAFSYIVPDECDDMHGAPPWCVDSNNNGTVQQNWLIARGDRFVGIVVNQITSSSMWETGNNAIVITFDEGNQASSQIYTAVIANHGPRGIKDRTSYNHYSLLASLQQTFGLGCLLHSCSATPMSKLFAITGSTNIPTLPPPYDFPTTTDAISKQGQGMPAAPVSLNGNGWQVVPTRNIGTLDNVLAGVSAAAADDVWAVGTYYPTATSPLATMAQHFDGTRWTATTLPSVGKQENTLLAVSMPSPGKAWAVGYYVNGRFKQRVLIEHYDGYVWSVVPGINPGAEQNILYGVAAVTDNDVWAVGGRQDVHGVWHTLTEHWDGSGWSEVKAVDAGTAGNQFYAVTANGPNDVYAVGQQSGTGFPSQTLLEHWDGTAWSVISTPTDSSASLLPLGLTANTSGLVYVGQHETDKAPYTTYAVAGAANALVTQATPNNGTGENDLFAATIGADGSIWAVGWDIDTNTGNHEPLVVQGQNGVWSLVPNPTQSSDSGFASIAAIPGGGLWAVGVTGNKQGNYGTLIEYHP